MSKRVSSNGVISTEPIVALFIRPSGGGFYGPGRLPAATLLVMRFVVIIGGPAAGKATVGQAVAERYGFKLFHNHVSIDAVTQVFDWGSPGFGRLVEEFRQRVVEEAAQADIDLIFTYVWAFGEPREGDAIERYRQTVLSHGGSVYFVELVTSLEERMARNGMASRRAMKQRSDEASTPEWIAEMDARYSFDSGGRLPFDEPQLRLDVTDLAPEGAAERIAEAFGFESAHPGTDR